MVEKQILSECSAPHIRVRPMVDQRIRGQYLPQNPRMVRPDILNYYMKASQGLCRV